MKNTPNPFETSGTGLQQLDRRDRWLWVVTLVLVLTQAAAIFVLYLPEISGESDSGVWALESKGIMATGLCGLVILFCLYILNKQNQMRQLRAQLALEMTQRENLAARLGELTALFEVATRMNPDVPLEDFLQAMIDRLVPGSRSQAGAIFLLEESGQKIRCVASVGHHGYGRVGSSWPAATAPFDAVAGAGATLRGEARTLTLPGASAPVGASALLLPLTGKRQHGAVVLLRTESAFDEVEATHLRLFASHAGHDLERLTRVVALEEHADRLADSHRHVTEREQEEWRFFAGLNREIRETLASIAYRVDACESEAAEEQRPELTDHIGALAAEVRRLSAAVQEGAALLDLQPEFHAIQVTDTSLGTILEDALLRATPLAGARGVVVEGRIPGDIPPVRTDGARLARTVSFYLAELLRRTPECGSLSISARAVVGPEINRRELQCEIRRDFEVPWAEPPRASQLPLYLLRELILSSAGSCQEIAEPTVQGVRFLLPLPADGAESSAAEKEIGGPLREAA